MVMVRNFEKYFPLNNIDVIGKKWNEKRNKKLWENMKQNKKTKGSLMTLKKFDMPNSNRVVY